jgi:hypothetical protein
MVATVQSQGVAYANGIIATIQSLADIQATIIQLNNINTQLNLGSVLSAFSTCASGTNGAPGAPDGSPVSGNWMNVAVSGQTGLTRYESAYSIGVALSILQQVNNLLSGSAVTTQPAAPNIIAQFTGG